MSETLDYLRTFAQFPLALRRYLRETLTLDEARRIINERMERRGESFLELAERSIYGYRASPYLALLKMAGCELGDLRNLVEQKGLEGALLQLRESGVYVSFEEFKGRRPIIRNGRTIPVTAQDFDNPCMHRIFTTQTGGSTGAAVNVGVDLDSMAARAPDYMVSLAAHGLLDVPSIRWSATLPAGALRHIMQFARFGKVPECWYSPTRLRDSKRWLRYALATYYMLLWMRLNGLRAPWPEYVTVDQAVVVARRVEAILREHKRCLLETNVSRTLRVCLAAEAAHIEVSGAVAAGSAEPVTPAKVRRIEEAGVRFIPNYGMVEASRIGSGCARPFEVGDVHLLKDAFALFAYPFVVEGFDLTVPAFNLTTLLSSAPKIMLNVQMDDYGIVEERHCGCELETYGYTTHLRQIRSYSKLTGEGVTLIGNEIGRILEEVLPMRFGGSPLDYQLLEQEDDEGFTRLFLVISPRVTIADEDAVVGVMMKALSASSPMADAAHAVWKHSHTIRVKRMEPTLTARGKLLPLHIERASASLPGEGDH
jgi:hypothetical protein